MATAPVVKLRRHRFLTDNPFRAVSSGSAESFTILRRKADSVAKAAKVGLLPDVPVSEILGTIDLVELPQMIRGLATDSVRRTCYRIMWPMSQETIAFLTEGGTLPKGQIPDEEHAQLLFLSSWLAYLESGSHLDAAAAFDLWEELYRNETMDERLISLLVEEDGTEWEAAHDFVLNAQRTVALTILCQVSSDAASSWDAGQTSQGVQLIDAVLKSPIEDELEELALEPITDYAHRLKDRVEVAIKDMSAWHRGDPTEPPREVIQLERIANALQGRLPSARDLQDTANDWKSALVWQMRQEALRLNREDDNAGAQQVIRAALNLTVTAPQKAKLTEDLGHLEKLISEEKSAAAYSEIKEVTSVPTLGTLNGFGLSLYGKKLFSADKRFYFKVLYFTMAFIPVFPIARYLVSDAPGGAWHFHGKTPWTQGMKIHCVFACTLILTVFLYFANIGSGIGGDVSFSKDSASTVVSPEHDEDASGTPSSPAENEAKNEGDSTAGQLNSAIDSENQAGSIFDGSTGRSERDAPESESEELERKLEALKVEIASIKSDIAVERAALDKDKVMLDALEAEIEASDPSPYSQDEIDVHNAKVQRHERLRVEFNASVRSYNQKVELEKKKVQKHNEVVDALNSRR